MPEAIWVVLIPAVAALGGSLIALIRQIHTERSRSKAAATERQLEVNDDLMAQYRALIEVHRTDANEARTELAAERAAHRVTTDDRDHWRAVATSHKEP